MKNIFAINQPRTFSLNEVHAILPVIYRITELAQNEVKSLMNRMQAIKSSNSSANSTMATEIEQEIDREVSRWEQKIEKLGGNPKGLWLADFDSGAGFYCWRFPETEIRFFHAYNEGFSGRKEINSITIEP